MTDAELVVEVLAGRTRAYAGLVERYHEPCLRLARHLLRNSADAEDVVQETFIRAYRGLGGYRERQTFRAWLYRILVNRCRTAGKQRRRREERVLVSSPVPNAPRTGVETDGFDLGSHLMRAMEGLDPRSREAFLLKVGEDLEYPELASLTGASVPALKMRVKRARDHIRARWEKLDRA
jgi:RNA polymerase sigma-70 factor (ECF subfamily)